MVTAKLHGKRLRIDVWIDVERNNFYKYSIKFHVEMNNFYKNSIKFHTDLINNFWSTKSNFPNLQGSSRNTSRWCLQNYMENGWELTSELTSKGITFTNIQSNFTLISLITFEVLIKTFPNLQGSSRNSSRWCLQNNMENGWELTSELTSKLITFTNIQSNFTLISLITFEL